MTTAYGEASGRSRSRFASRATLVAFMLSLLAAIYLVVAPTYQSVMSSASLGSGPGPTLEGTRSTLIQVEGWSVLVVLMIPILICFAALLLSRKRPARSVAAILMTTFVIVSGFSIGLLYAPSALAMIVAALAKA